MARRILGLDLGSHAVKAVEFRQTLRGGGRGAPPRPLPFPSRERRKSAPAVPFEVESQVPFDLSDYFVDWEVIGEQAGRTEVTATLAPRSEVALLLEPIREAGINPRIVE